jgi:hypothetical protein
MLYVKYKLIILLILRDELALFARGHGNTLKAAKSATYEYNKAHKRKLNSLTFKFRMTFTF